MKCSECGHVCRSLKAMLKHWDKKHPVLLAKRKAAGRARKREAKAPARRKLPPPPSDGAQPAGATMQHYCPVCGRLH